MPNLSECVKSAIEQMRPQLKTGDFGNGLKFFPLENVRTSDIFIRRTGIVSNITNQVTLGTGDFVIEKIKIDLNQPLIDLIIRVPKTVTKAISENSYNFGWLNSKSRSNFTSVISNYKARITVKGKQEIRNGEKYINFTSFKVVSKITQIKFRLDNAFADRILNEAVNSFLNQNADIVIPDIEKSNSKDLSEYLMNSKRLIHS